MPSLLHGGLQPASPPDQRAPAGAEDLAAALLRLADEDADAYADRLHDGLLQALVVARYATDAVVRGGDPGMARDAVQEALVALRRTVWLLRPRVTNGLSQALLELAAQRAAAGLPAPVLDLDPELVTALPPDAAAVAYRFVQAVLDEAGTDPLRVRLERSAGFAAVEVAAALRNPAGWALRARAVGGGLVVGAGRLRLLLPLPELPEIPLHDDREAAP